MKIEIGTPATGNDLAGLLRDNTGTFLAQQSGQCFVVVTAEGHSIKFGPKPVGRRFIEIGSGDLMPGGWTVTKLSDSDLSTELGNQYYTGNTRTRTT